MFLGDNYLSPQDRMIDPGTPLSVLASNFLEFTARTLPGGLF